MGLQFVNFFLLGVDDAIEQFLGDVLVFDLVGEFSQSLFAMLELVLQLLQVFNLHDPILLVLVHVHNFVSGCTRQQPERFHVFALLVYPVVARNKVVCFPQFLQLLVTQLC